MLSPDHRTKICNALHGAILDQLTQALADHPLDELADSLVYWEAFIQPRTNVSTTEARPNRKLVSKQIDLSQVIASGSRLGIVAPPPADLPTPPGDDTQPSDTEIPGPGESASGAARNTHTPQTGVRDTLDAAHAVSRRPLGGLRPAKTNTHVTIINDVDDDVTTMNGTYRQMHIKAHNFPKRAKNWPDGVFNPKELSLTKFVVGVYEQIHSGIKLEPAKLTEQLLLQPATSQSSLPSAPLLLFPAPSPSTGTNITTTNDPNTAAAATSFTHQNLLCRRITLLSRACRSVETIVQARWIEHFDDHVARLLASAAGSTMSATKARQAALASACRDFGWGEKELRNKMAIWRGYKQIKDAGGWAMLVFAGMGLYRLCKYRVGFEGTAKDGGSGLRKVLGAARERVAVAADTLHPEWRGLLTVVGVDDADEVMGRPSYTGHPHDWVVADGGAVVPLRETYRDGLLDGFEHVDECVVDAEAWGGRSDPRVLLPVGPGGGGRAVFVCQECRQEQSDDLKVNNCYCFPGLFGCAQRLPCPVQIFRTANGRNNGLQALQSFERGIGIGEFVGLVTKGIEGVDVMDAVVGGTKYQIWQGRQGNFTRFINHSCKPNAQFQRFVWLGTQHVILVSKGIEAGWEITVDYSPTYWKGLSKRCLCGERCCRYQEVDRR